MMDYDSGGTTSDEDDLMGHVEDEDILTPQVQKTEDEIIGHFEPPPTQGGDGVGFFSPAAAKLMSFQRALFNQKGRGKAASKAGGSNVMQSPGPPSPPLVKSIESSSLGGPFSPRISAKHDMGSRRESLSLGTKDLNLSDREESDEGAFSTNSNEHHGSSKHAKPSLDDRKNVIRRAVTRRGNMLVGTFFYRPGDHLLTWDGSRNPKTLREYELRYRKRAPLSTQRFVERQKSFVRCAKATRKGI